MNDEKFECGLTILTRRAAGKPGRVLVLASDVLFSHFFTEGVRGV